MGISGAVSAVFNAAANATLADWLLLTGACAAILYVLGTYRHGHFRRRGIPQMEGLWPFFGNFGKVTVGAWTFSDLVRESYLRFKGQPMYGIFPFQRPVLVIRDLELIKNVAVKDFDHFTDHLKVFSGKTNPLFEKNLFNLEGQQWRDMRATLSPAFTSSKMRSMFKLIDACGERAVRYLHGQLADNPVYEANMKDFFTCFTNDCIATSAFGIQVDSLQDRNNDFYRRGRELTNMKGLKSLLFLGYMLSPKLMEALGLSMFSNHILEFFHKIVHNTIDERQKKNIFRPDMLQLLMQARAGQLNVDKEDEHEKETLAAKKLKLTESDITAQALIFFFAGFETVSTLMCFMSMRLAHHPDVQQRLQREIDEVLEACGGTVSYEAVQNMKYLDMVINEVQRLHSGGLMDRLCVKDYTIPARGGLPAYTVRAGDVIWLPQHGLHHDPDYWPDPERFDPERFSDANKANIKPFTHMPFGVGPRICIGSRFALMETKIVLMHILRNFNFVMTPKTPKKIEFATLDFSLGIKGGFWVGMEKREDLAWKCERRGDFSEQEVCLRMDWSALASV